VQWVSGPSVQKKASKLQSLSEGPKVALQLRIGFKAAVYKAKV